MIKFKDFIVEKKEEFIKITTPLGSKDFEIFKDIINRGIDSHLEAFVKSKFEKGNNRYNFNFHKSEKPILLRRLQSALDATGDEDIERWFNDIKKYKD